MSGATGLPLLRPRTTQGTGSPTPTRSSFPFGGTLSFQSTGPPLGARTFGLQHNVDARLTQISYPGSVAPQLSYGYDLRGNLESVSGGGFSVAYERRLDDRIDGMTFSNGVDNSRAYDADGRLTETNYRRGSAAPFIKAAYALNSLGQRISVERANGYGDTFAYDGNGNVTELTGGSGGTVASYRYTAFGDTWSKSGSAADANHYRFSTKPLDAETISASNAAFQDGLYYYGFRYYDPVIGRWPSRDPIGERGGLNIYVAFLNEPIGRLDPFGLTDCSHTIQLAHLFSDGEGTSNWEHFNSEANDGSTCYVGCGMNYLNDQQGELYSENAAGTSPIPPQELTWDVDTFTSETNNGYTEFPVGPGSGNEDLVPDDYDGPDVLDTIDEAGISTNINERIDEIVSDKCGDEQLCCSSVSIPIVCPQAGAGGASDPLCGTTVSRTCD